MEIKLVHVTKSFGAKQVIQPTSFVIQSGSLTTLLGPSGCGKTTLLRMIAGLETPDSGEIWFENRCVFSSEKKINIPPEKRGLGFVFQDFALWPHMTVFENVAFGLRAAGKTDKLDEKVKNALHAVQLDDFAQRYPHQLSGGQQQRVALARALVAQPGLLLLDEPLSNLDAKLRESMRFEILSIQKALGITVVYVTHDQGEAMAMSDRVVVMSKGVVQQIGAPHEIYTNPANKMVADFIGLVNFMQGEVSDDRVYLQGTTASFPNTSGVSGSATIAVRPENITMSRGGGMLEGTLTHRFYLGDAVDYRVTVGDHDVRVIVKGADLKEFADGEKVYLDFEKVMIFDRE